MRYVRLAAFVAVMLAPLHAYASPITLAWDPSPDSTAIGYIVHLGTSSGAYSQSIDVGNQLSFVYPDAVDGTLYYFAVGAYAAARQEGPLSNEVAGYSNAPPQLTNPGNQSNIVGDSVALQLTASDPYGQPLTFSATGLPDGLSVGSSTGLIAGIPTVAAVFAVTVVASDGVLSDAQSFSWTIATSSTSSPVWITITSPAANPVTVSLPWLQITGTAGGGTGVTAVTWTTDRGDTGTATGTTAWSARIQFPRGTTSVTFTAHDAAGSTAGANVTVTRRR